MKITEIKAQIKTKGRYSIFVDGNYEFSLSDTALLEQKLIVGQELDASELKQLKQASEDDKLYGQVLQYIALRPHSEWEVRTYLKRKHATPALADYIVNKLSDTKLIDDAHFASSWVGNRRLLHPSSKRKLQQELRAKHVNSEAIEQALTEDEGSEQTALQELIAKKRSRYPDKLKLMQYLSRQGFNYSDIRQALDNM
jgi:regulatory protein